MPVVLINIDISIPPVEEASCAEFIFATISLSLAGIISIIDNIVPSPSELGTTFVVNPFKSILPKDWPIEASTIELITGSLNSTCKLNTFLIIN